MATHRKIILLLLFTVMVIPLYATRYEDSFILEYTQLKLPVDNVIGQMVQPKEGSVEELTLNALTQSFSLDWIETYVPEDLRNAFTKNFSKDLAKILPLKGVQVAGAVRRGNLFEVAIRYTEPEKGYGTVAWMETENVGYSMISVQL